MKKLFIFIVLSVLSKVASAESVEVNGVFYNLVPKAKIAEVTGNPNGYEGELTIPSKIIYESVEYSVNSIGDQAFYNCQKLIKVDISESVSSIGEYAFSFCQSLVSVRIPNSVTSIGVGAFSYCTSLETVEIPEGVTTIHYDAFYRCSKLSTVYLPSSLESIGGASFYECNNLKELHIKDLASWCHLKTSGTSWNPLSYAHHLYIENQEIKELILPESVTYICEGAFCGGLFESVFINDGVKEIKSCAFADCNGITSIVLPNSVTDLGLSIFSGCKNLEYITLSNGLTTIYGSSLYGSGSFAGCPKLKGIVIPEGVTSIGYRAFAYCKALEYVVIPETVNQIDGFAFEDCENLSDVYCYNRDVPSTSANAFDNSYPEYITLHVPLLSEETYKMTSPWDKFKSIVAIKEDDPNTTGILNISDNKCADQYFDMKGNRITKLQKGINIIRTRNGETKKIISRR